MHYYYTTVVTVTLHNSLSKCQKCAQQENLFNSLGVLETGMYTWGMCGERLSSCSAAAAVPELFTKVAVYQVLVSTQHLYFLFCFVFTEYLKRTHYVSRKYFRSMCQNIQETSNQKYFCPSTCVWNFMWGWLQPVLDRSHAVPDGAVDLYLRHLSHPPAGEHIWAQTYTIKDWKKTKEKKNTFRTNLYYCLTRK